MKRPLTALIQKRTALEITQKAINVVSPILGSLIEVTVGSINKAQDIAGKGGIDELRRESERQELMMQMTERQAKVAQELALAHRIESAQEVEMEEFYDLSSAGHAGVKSDGTNATVGIGARAQQVTKRIFRFKGITPSA